MLLRHSILHFERVFTSSADPAVLTLYLARWPYTKYNGCIKCAGYRFRRGETDARKPEEDH